MDLILDFEKDTVIIKLIDNPLVRDWALHLNTTDLWDCWNVPQCVYEDNGEKEKYRLEMIAAIEDFNATNKVKFPFQVTKDTQFTRKDLNLIHRWFTTGTSFTCWSLDTGPIVSREDYSIFYEKASAINDVVHFLENYYDGVAKAHSKHVNYQFFKLNSLKNDQYFDHKPGDWRYLDYDCEYDVFMTWAICGKDYFQAYIDDDDPRQWDITAQWCSYYNYFYIDTNGERNKILKSKEFTEFLKKGHVYNTAWQYMPIGKVISGKYQHHSTFKGLRLN